MSMFDDNNLYDSEYFDTLTFAEQRDLFLRIRSWAVDAEKTIKYNKTKYRKLFLKKIEEIAGFACMGHIPSQDYMGYIYKRGFSDFFPINYKRALEWNIIAAHNCSKLAPQKMKAFLNSSIDKIFMHSKFPQIVKFNGLNLKNYFWFLGQYVCDVLYVEMGLSPAEMSKKEIVEEDLNELATIISLDRLRDTSVAKALVNLQQALPDKIVADEIIASPEDLDNPDEEDIDINIEEV